MRKPQLLTLVRQCRAHGFDQSCLTRDGTRLAVRVRCSQCEALVINGHPCHERGCPNASHTLDDDA